MIGVLFSTQYEERDEQKEFETGPLSVLMQSVRQNTQVGFSVCLCCCFVFLFMEFSYFTFSPGFNQLP